MIKVVGTYVYEQVVALFAARAGCSDIIFNFGWREQNKRVEGNVRSRVTFVPGDPSGKLGKLNMAKYPGPGAEAPRNLGSLDELITIYCYAMDRDNPEDELLNYNATRLLWDDVYAALWRVYHGHFSIDDIAYSHKALERRSGCEIRAIIKAIAPIPDTFDETVVVQPTKVEGDITAPNDVVPYEVTAT